MNKQQATPKMGRGKGMIVGDKPKNFKETFTKLLNYTKPFRLTIIMVIIFACMGTLFSLFAPMIMATITNELFDFIKLKATGAVATIDFALITQIIMVLIAMYVLSSLFVYLQNFFMAGVTQKITYNLRQDIAQKMNRLPISYYDTHSHGDILSRITNDVDTISSTMQQGIVQLITSLTTVIGVLIMMFIISPLLAIVSILVLPATALFVRTLIKRSQTYFRSQQNDLGALNGHVEEMYGAHVIVKAFNGEAKALTEFQEKNKALYNSAWKAQFLSGLMMPVINIISNISYVAICVLGGYLAIAGTLTVGGIQAFMQYMKQFTQPIAQLGQISNIIQSTMAASERVFVFLEEEEELPITDEASVPAMKNNISFNQVFFGYHQDNTVIKDFNLTVQPGQRIAIVGHTGAGKTTLMNLLLRFYDIQQGTITIDNQNINHLNRQELRKLFGIVLQDAWLFHGTIAENIAYGKPHATKEEIYAAAKAASVHHFIKTLPQGYDTVIQEDAENISQGQRQLITIARAIISDSPIMIMDEATSSVDTRTEILIQQAMNKLMEGRTSFIIAHRLSTIRDADSILVLHEGNIIEQGTHQELLAQGQHYAALYNSQFAKAQ